MSGCVCVCVRVCEVGRRTFGRVVFGIWLVVSPWAPCRYENVQLCCHVPGYTSYSCKVDALLHSILLEVGHTDRATNLREYCSQVICCCTDQGDCLKDLPPQYFADSPVLRQWLFAAVHRVGVQPPFEVQPRARLATPQTFKQSLHAWAPSKTVRLRLVSDNPILRTPRPRRRSTSWEMASCHLSGTMTRTIAYLHVRRMQLCLFPPPLILGRFWHSGLVKLQSEMIISRSNLMRWQI